MSGIDKTEVLERALQAGALLEHEDKSILFDLAMKHIRPLGIAVEVGSWNGGSAVILGSVCKLQQARLYCIDAFSDDVHKYGVLSNTERLFKFVSNTNGLPVSIVTGDSTKVHHLIRDGCADFVFIDGDHHYEVVKNDVINYGRKVKQGGVICGHDYGGGITGVAQAVDEALGIQNVSSHKYIFWCTDLSNLRVLG